jgi:hypothetical protein
MNCSSSESENNLVCSGHGYCSLDSTPYCICDKGWTGFGAFSFKDQFYCDINRDAVTTIYYVIICTTAVSLLVVLRLFMVQMMKRNTFFIFNTTGRSIFPLMLFAEMAFQVIFAVLKVIYKDNLVIGRDVLLTFFYMVLPMISHTATVFYFFVVLNVLRLHAIFLPPESKRKLVRQFSISHRMSMLVPPLSFVVCMLPLVGLAFPDFQQVFAKTYLIGCGLNVLFFGFLILSALGTLTQLLSHHTKNFPQSTKDLVDVLYRLRLAYVLITVMTLSLGLSFLVFGCSTFLLRKTTYLILFQTLSVPPASVFLIMTVSRLGPNKKRNSNVSVVSVLSGPSSNKPGRNSNPNLTSQTSLKRSSNPDLNVTRKGSRSSNPDHNINRRSSI